jgi:hypothetical protein
MIGLQSARSIGDLLKDVQLTVPVKTFPVSTLCSSTSLVRPEFK